MHLINVCQCMERLTSAQYEHEPVLLLRVRPILYLFLDDCMFFNQFTHANLGKVPNFQINRLLARSWLSQLYCHLGLEVEISERGFIRAFFVHASPRSKNSKHILAMDVRDDTTLSHNRVYERLNVDRVSCSLCRQPNVRPIDCDGNCLQRIVVCITSRYGAYQCSCHFAAVVNQVSCDLTRWEVWITQDVRYVFATAATQVTQHLKNS